MSARVHPGETPSQYIINGIINILIDKESESSNILRQNFIFYFIPMLNPDGVYRGHYRTDSLGQNLNR